MNVIVFAFDPVEELGNACGLLVLSPEVAGRLVAERRVEAVAEHQNAPLRFVAGSPANLAAAAALRRARELVRPASRVRRPASLER